MVLFFFFQAEDGIRDLIVTGVQTCALPISKYATDPGPAYHVSPGNRMPTITLTRDGWTAAISSPNTTQQCAVFVGSTPLAPATREGAPACEKPSSSATPLP